MGEGGTVATDFTDNGQNADSGQDTKDAAKEKARGVAQEGVKAGEHVAAVASDQAKEVASEAGQQAKSLIEQARTELTDSLASQQSRIADALHALSHELGSMASKSEEEGLAANLASQASRQVGGIAHWISEREPGTLVTEVKDVARNKPGTFLAVAAGIGLVAGRMTRAAKAGAPEGDSDNAASESHTTPHSAGDGLHPKDETSGEQSWPMPNGTTP